MSADFNIQDEKFEMYDQLYDQFKDVTEGCNLQTLGACLRKLDKRGYMIVSLIIQKHARNTKHDDTKSSIPFGGSKVNSQDVKFDIRDFDPVLQHILLEFSARYLVKEHKDT